MLTAPDQNQMRLQVFTPPDGPTLCFSLTTSSDTFLSLAAKYSSKCVGILVVSLPLWPRCLQQSV